MKKNFTGGLNSLLGEPQPPQPESNQPEPKPKPVSDLIPQSTEHTASDVPAVKSTQLGTRAGEARATFIVNEATHEKIKAIAYWERLQIKEVIDEALSSYVNQYEKQHGPIKSVPTRKGQ